MEALTELCDIIERNPKQFLDKLLWICRQCPQPKVLDAKSVRVSRSHLNAILAVARIISSNVDTAENHGKFVVLDFFQAVPKSFHRSFWPHSITLESISAFYSSFLGYVSCLSLELGTKVVELMEEAMMSCGESVRDPAISRAFLVALSQNFPSIEQSVGDKLLTILLHQFAVVNGGSIMWTSGDDELNFGYSEGSKHMFTQKLASFEDESIDSLEKQEIAFKLVTNILGKVKVDSRLHLQVRSIAKRQLQSMSEFLKSRRQDWNKQDPVLRTRVNAELFLYQAAAQMEIESLVSLETKGRKRLVLETLTLLLDAAEACLTSVWRKMKACKDLFSSLLSGIAKIAVAEGGQPLRLLLIRLKPLVLAVCAQPDTWVSSQGNMFESIFKISCEIIESGWAKDQASVDTFIVGLASSIRGRYDYEEQGDREKQVPGVLLNVIQLLADITNYKLM